MHRLFRLVRVLVGGREDAVERRRVAERAAAAVDVGAELVRELRMKLDTG